MITIIIKLVRINYNFIKICNNENCYLEHLHAYAFQRKKQQASFPKQAYWTSSAVASWKKLAIVTVIEIIQVSSYSL